MNEKYPFPVYGTQGGGLVREIEGRMIFVEAPDGFPELPVGSDMPEMWGMAPANEAARKEMRDEQF